MLVARQFVPDRVDAQVEFQLAVARQPVCAQLIEGLVVLGLAPMCLLVHDEQAEEFRPCPPLDMAATRTAPRHSALADGRNAQGPL